MIELKSVPELICDEFGNYVIQVLLAIAEENNKNKFISMINAIKGTMKNLLQSEHGRKVYDKLTMEYSSHFKNSKKTKSSKKGGEK